MKTTFTKRYGMLLVFFAIGSSGFAQMLQLPDCGFNLKSDVSRRVRMTDKEIHWNAPRVKEIFRHIDFF